MRPRQRRRVSASATTACGGTKVYGTADPALSATTATGFTATDNGTIALTATRAPSEAVGSYATTATASRLGVSNYSVRWHEGVRHGRPGAQCDHRDGVHGDR